MPYLKTHKSPFAMQTQVVEDGYELMNFVRFRKRGFTNEFPDVIQVNDMSQKQKDLEKKSLTNNLQQFAMYYE